MACCLISQNSYARRTIERALPKGQSPSPIIIAQPIISDSDSLYLNEHLLSREIHYTYNYMRGEIRFSAEQIVAMLEFRNISIDSFHLSYQSAPSWIALSYGNSPESYQSSGGKLARPFTEGAVQQFSGGSRQIEIEGAKTFRFTGQSTGTNAFGQSLDLTISGMLSPGVEVSGTISDRGRSTSYGPANLQVSELDRVNLAVTSRQFSARIGDIQIEGQPNSIGCQQKSISGAEARFSSPSISISGVAGRPRGQFRSSDFNGQDNLQGPYRIVNDQLTRIVPGSEIVRVDGRSIEKGEHKDYNIDYAAGTITFTVGRIINSRSRIEIDYEVLQSDFRGELFGGVTGFSLVDSSVQLIVNWVREGDDRSRPIGYQPDKADSVLLEQAGDELSMLYRSGVQIDSLGSYDLLVDSLPDSVFIFVGAGLGEYSVSFSNVDRLIGSYDFLGGDRYQFVGAGKGDYAPIIILPVPKRTDEVGTRLLLGNKKLGQLEFEYQHESRDLNLYSPLDDDDNGSALASVNYTKEYQFNGKQGRTNLSYRHRDKNYKGRTRLYSSDFAYQMFLPELFVPLSDERLWNGQAGFAPMEMVDVEFGVRSIQYQDLFESLLAEYGTTLNYQSGSKIWYVGTNLSAKLDSGLTELDGSSTTNAFGVQQRIGQITLTTEYKKSLRTNFYFGDERGTRYDQLATSVKFDKELLSAEFYSEDSLAVDWSQNLNRQEYKLRSSRNLWNLQLDLTSVYSRINADDSTGENFMGRINYNFRPSQTDYSFSGSYLISNEARQGRSVRYQEVSSGTGNYIFEDSQYIPQVNGDFILLEELLSDRQQVHRGEKDFRYRHKIGVGVIQVSSRVREELFEQSSRSIWWLVPFWSHQGDDFLFYDRSYNIDLKLFRLESGYGIIINWDQTDQARLIAGSSNKNHESAFRGTVREKLGQLYGEQSVEYFEFKSDQLYGSAADITGQKLQLGLIRTVGRSETKLTVSYRNASTSTDITSQIYATTLGYVYRVVKRGEIRLSSELYRQEIGGSQQTTLPFRLTENKSGSRGVVWKLAFNYGLGHQTRLNLLVDGRHSDSRHPRLFLRGEMVVGL